MRDRLAELLQWYQQTEWVRMIGMRVLEVGDDWARTALEPPADLLNPNGAVNGGILACYMDLTGGLLVGRSVEEGQPSATIELGIHFMRAAAQTPLTATARVRRRGRSLMFVSVDAVDAAGKPCVSATGTWVIGHGSVLPSSSA